MDGIEIQYIHQKETLFLLLVECFCRVPFALAQHTLTFFPLTLTGHVVSLVR